MRAPLLPSLIIETKNGYQVYWASKNATQANFDAIEKILVERYDADKNAKDICRLLRVPGFWHSKDPTAKFLIKVIHKEDVSYSEQEMFLHFRSKVQVKKNIIAEKPREINEDNFWLAANKIPCDYALQLLSGTSHVNGDQIELRQNTDGTKQIWVNNKSTACWVDKNNLIGSHAGGGPSIANWINWYYADWGRTAEILKEVFKDELKVWTKKN